MIHIIFWQTSERTLFSLNLIHVIMKYFAYFMWKRNWKIRISRTRRTSYFTLDLQQVSVNGKRLEQYDTQQETVEAASLNSFRESLKCD